MMKGKKKWLTVVAAALAAALAVTQPALVPLVPVLLDALGVPQPVDRALPAGPLANSVS